MSAPDCATTNRGTYRTAGTDPYFTRGTTRFMRAGHEPFIWDLPLDDPSKLIGLPVVVRDLHRYLEERWSAGRSTCPGVKTISGFRTLPK